MVVMRADRSGDRVRCRACANGFWRQLLSRYGSDNAVLQTCRQLVWPLVHRLICDAYCSRGSGDRPAEQFNGFVFTHAVFVPRFNQMRNLSSICVNIQLVRCCHTSDNAYEAGFSCVHPKGTVWQHRNAVETGLLRFASGRADVADGPHVGPHPRNRYTVRGRTATRCKSAAIRGTGRISKSRAWRGDTTTASIEIPRTRGGADCSLNPHAWGRGPSGGVLGLCPSLCDLLGPPPRGLFCARHPGAFRGLYRS